MMPPENWQASYSLITSNERLAYRPGEGDFRGGSKRVGSHIQLPDFGATGDGAFRKCGEGVSRAVRRFGSHIQLPVGVGDATDLTGSTSFGGGGGLLSHSLKGLLQPSAIRAATMTTSAINRTRHTTALKVASSFGRMLVYENRSSVPGSAVLL